MYAENKHRKITVGHRHTVMGGGLVLEDCGERVEAKTSPSDLPERLVFTRRD